MVLKRGMIILVNLDPTKGSETGKVRPCIVVTNDTYNKKVPVIQVVPITEWTEKKARIITNVTIPATTQNGLTKLSIADCLQTRPIDHSQRLVAVKGELESETLSKIDLSLKTVFDLDQNGKRE